MGSDEESDNKDISSYLEEHAPPNYSLVLDADFPVTVGEKAWQALVVSAPPELLPRAPGRLAFGVALDAGLAASIVPDRAKLTLAQDHGLGGGGPTDWTELRARRVLVEVLVDLACNPPLREPFAK